MKRLLLGGAAALATLAPLPALAQPAPPPGGRQPLTFQQQMAQAQQQQADREAQARAQHQRDLQRMTPDRAEAYEAYARDRLNQALEGHNLEAVGNEMRRDLERNGRNLEQTVGGNAVFNRDPAQTLSNRQFGEEGAHGAVQGSNTFIQTNRDLLTTARPLIEDIGRAQADIAEFRRQMLEQSNPGMSQGERDRLRYETERAANGGRNIGRRLDEADYNLREAQRRITEAEDRIAREMERMANEQGQNPQTWQVSQRTPPSGPQPRPRPLPVPDAAPPPAADPAPPGDAAPASPQANAGGTRTPSRRGEIPGQNGDPYEGLRVPQNQGGTGANPQQPVSGNRNDQAARDRAQAEANAERMERNRQAAEDRMRQDNAEADAIFGAAERERQARAARERAEMEEWLRRQSRPGNVGGGGGASGSGTGGMAEQMAAGDGYGDLPFSPTGDFFPGEVESGDPGTYSPTEAFIFADGGSFDPAPDAWQSFEMGGIITVAELVPIYDGYDWWNAPVGSSGRSLSSAGTSLSSAGNSLSSAGISLSSAGSITPSSAPTGMRVDWGGYNLAADPLRVSNGGRPEPGSYADMLRQINGPGPSALGSNPWVDTPWATSHPDLARALYGPLWSDRPYQIQADPFGSRGRGRGGPEVANLYDSDLDRLLRLLGDDFTWLRTLIAGDRGGLERLLAQPFNVLLTWGPNAFDLDLHMTGPLETADQRFHIYYAGRGQLDAQPFAELIRDCICNSGSEVILTSALNQGSGVYRVSVFNFGDQSASSTNLANQSQATLQIVRGGVAVPVGNGTTIEGGTSLLTVTVPQNQPGNTWVAAEINPNNGTITAPNVIVQSQGSGNVQ